MEEELHPVPSEDTTPDVKRGTECLNCGHPLELSFKYCPNCSQTNNPKKLSFKDFLDEFLSNIVSYDSKLWRTLVALLTRPGKITADYIAGKRVRYTNPFRFLLSLAIVYFLLINVSGDFSKWDKYGSKDERGLFVNFDKGGPGFILGQSGRDSIEAAKEIEDFMKTRELRKKEFDSLVQLSPNAELSKFDGDGFFDRMAGKINVFGVLIRKKDLTEFEEAMEQFGIPRTWENKTAFNLSNSLVHATRAPGSFFSTLISRLPFLTFFFLPVFALFIWMAYIRKKYNYADHLVFSFHIQSLYFILLIISILLDSLLGIQTSWFFLIVFCFYLYKAMRRFYRQGRVKTIVKYVYLNTIFFILAILSMSLLLAGSLFTY